MTKFPPLYLIDAYGLIYRSYFAFLSHPLRNSTGKNISALFGFARALVSLIDEGAPSGAGDEGASDSTGRAGQRRPLRLAAAFDSRTPTFRHKKYSEYKANREKAPEDLHAQVPLVEELLSALGVPALRLDGFEADDIIATLAEKCKKEKRQCYILSSDKDLLQLVGKGVYELRPQKTSKDDAGAGKAGGLAWELVGPAEVKAEWGVIPEKVLDLLSLTGDSSDNVPGVRGIGEKTAVKLMARYGSLDEIYKNIAGIEGAVGKKLAEGRESAYFSQDLIRLDCAVPLPVKDIDELSVENLNRPAGARILFREGIRQSAKQLDPKAGSGGAADSGQAETPAREEAPAAPAPAAQFNSGGAVPADSALLGGGVYETILELDKLKTLLAGAKKQKLLALDFETDSLDAWNSRPIGISLALRPKEAFYAPLAPHRGIKAVPEGENAGAENADTENAPFLDPEKVRTLLAPLLADKDMTIVAHNAKFDYKVSRGWGINRWQCKIWDTMVAAWLADPERNNYSLDSLASYAFNYTPIAYKDVVPKGGAFDQVPLETACRYSAEDADLCLRMKRYLEPQLEKAEAPELFSGLEMPLLPILAEMEGAGIKIEPKVLKSFGQELFAELNRIQDETWKTVGHQFNLASPKQLQEVLFVERKLKPGKKTKTGYSTDVDVLAGLSREDPVPALILRHRTLAKLKSTYVDALADLADREGRLHTSFVQTGTATGRLSSRDPNLQNIPIRDEEGRRIREAFTAKTGCVLISADYSQIELVVLAHLSEDEGLCSAFREGKDVHVRTAALIFGIDESKVDGSRRRIAKTINFGVMYGMSAFRLANELGISRTDAAAFIDAYFKTYAGVSRFIGELIKRTEETGYASTILGRRRYIPAINSRNKTEKAAAERVAVNTPIQGSAADIVKTAMLNLDKRLNAEKSPARLLLQVHDELILECPKEEAPAAARLTQEVMEQAVTLRIPLRVSVETGKRWGDFH
ncbi:MAG: DNA polymerase I [Treponema sp.]|jgi:DNA polymerase-1|nr:DNA polymerase I [Treponema sp.]